MTNRLAGFLIVMTLSLAWTQASGEARDYIIYSIVQDLPMGYENEVVKKNFYINMGKNQGVDQGAVLDVFRTVSRLDPYSSKKRYNYRVKIAEIQVIHSEENSAIAKMSKLREGEDAPIYDIDNLMIGDQVDVHVRD